MTVPILILAGVGIIFAGVVTWEIHQMDRARRDALPTNHPSYKPKKRGRNA